MHCVFENTMFSECWCYLSENRAEISPDTTELSLACHHPHPEDVDLTLSGETSQWQAVTIAETCNR